MCALLATRHSRCCGWVAFMSTPCLPVGQVAQPFTVVRQEPLNTLGPGVLPGP